MVSTDVDVFDGYNVKSPINDRCSNLFRKFSGFLKAVAFHTGKSFWSFGKFISKYYIGNPGVICTGKEGVTFGGMFYGPQIVSLF